MPSVHGALDRVVEEAEERDEVPNDAGLEEYDKLAEDVGEARGATRGQGIRVSRAE